MRDPIRLLLVQPTLAKYRAPVYKELAARPEIDLRVWYGDHYAVPNVEPDGFRAELRPLRAVTILGQEARWHGAQLEAAASTDADAVILSWSSRYLSLGPALRRARRRGLPVILWGHGYSRQETGFSLWARERIARMASALLFYESRSAQAAIDRGWPADRVFVAPNAIDQSPIQAARADWLADPGRLAGFREEHGLQGRRVLLYVSRIQPENRVDLLLDAVDRLRRTRPDVLAVLIGAGDLYDATRAAVDAKGLGDHVRLLGPVYEETRLAPWFLSSEAFVYPSAIGLSLLHALGYGLPVVTDDCVATHNPEIIAYEPDPDSPDANGVAYRAGDADDMARTLDELLRDDERRARLADGALRTVADRYNVPMMVDGFVAAAQRVVADR